MSTVEAAQRFTRRHPCSVCGGGDDSPRGKGKRCSGYLSSDGRFAYCTREELAGGLEPQPTEPTTYRHLVEGDCWCGVVHGAGRGSGGPVESRFVYVDERGNPLYRTVRLDGPDEKRIWQERFEDGRFVKGLGRTRRVLYRLPELADAETVHVVEGERCADALHELGFVATTSPMGAGKWRPEYADALGGAYAAVIWPDCDEQGRAHAETIARSLAASEIRAIRIVELDRDRQDGYDVADLVAEGRRNGKREDLRGWIESIVEQAPVFEPEPKPADDLDLTPDAEPGARPILFVTLREFLKLDFPPAESLVGHVRGGTNLLPRYGWVMPWGREGSTKTTLVVDLLFHAAAGRQWQHYPIARPLRIVAIVNEGVPGGFQDKLAEKIELWDDVNGPLDGLALYASPWGEFTFRNERMLRHLSDFARDFEADYVAGDPLHTLGSTGSGTPEETEEFKHLLRGFGVWEWIGILTAHHSNKAGMVSGDWARHPDTVVHLEKDGRQPRTKLTLQKARPADPAELGVPQLLEWVVETKGYRLVEGDPGKIADANRERVLDAVRDGLRSAADVGERTGLSTKTAKRHFRDLERDGLVRVEEGPNRMLLASLGGEEDDIDFESDHDSQEELEWS